MLAIRLDKDIEDRLTLLARKTGRTKTYYAREAILEHLQDLEDAYLATERLQARRFGKALKAQLSGLWRYRVRDFRIICQIQDGILVVLVLAVSHRKAIYR